MVFILIGVAALQSGIISAEYNESGCPLPVVLLILEDESNNLLNLVMEETIALNEENIHFVNPVITDNKTRELAGNEYELNIEAAQQDDIAFVYMILVDSKKREVHREKVEQNIEGGDSTGLNKHLSQTISQKMTPMIEIIREHQEKIREEDNSAINARLECEENSFTIGLNQELTVEFELIDCDGYLLSERLLEIKHQGVGIVTPLQPYTDEKGRGNVLFKSEKSGKAEVEIIYRSENTDGITLQAEELVKINVLDDVSCSHALVEGEMSGDGVVSRGRMLSCNGIGGVWKYEWELIFSRPDVQGTLAGNGSFTFSDDPRPGDTASASLDMSGTLIMDNVSADYTGVLQLDVVLLEESKQLQIRIEAGTLTGQVVVTTPDGTATVPLSLPIQQGEAVPIQFVSYLPECEN
ncbi:MAG: hypothetical protein ACOCUP_01365 [bacterium]